MIVEAFLPFLKGGGMGYLEPAEYRLFGLAEETPDSLVAAASAMVDTFCRRPSLAVTAYVERLRVARDGCTLRLSNLPLAAAAGAVSAITGCRVRLRRPDAFATALQRDAAVFGLGGAWSSVDPAGIVTYANGEIEVPARALWMGLGLPFDEAEVTYTAGYAVVPDAVKRAVAQIVQNAQTTPGLTVKRQQVDTMAMDYFAPSLLDDDVKRLLQPYVAVRFA